MSASTVVAISPPKLGGVRGGLNKFRNLSPHGENNLCVFVFNKKNCQKEKNSVSLCSIRNKAGLLRDKAGLLRDKAGLSDNKRGLSDGAIVVAEVLAAGRQLVMYERGQRLFQLQEEPFAGLVAVGIHVE